MFMDDTIKNELPVFLIISGDRRLAANHQA